MFNIWLGAPFTKYSISSFSIDFRHYFPFYAQPFSSFLIRLCPTPFFIFLHDFINLVLIFIISFVGFIMISPLCSILFLPFPMVPILFLPFSFVPSCSFYFSVSHYVPSISSLGRYVFGSEISYNKAPPRLPGLGC